MAADLQYADGLIAQSMTLSSWSRNSAWVKRFKAYVDKVCPGFTALKGMRAAVSSDRMALAFLASTAREDPSTKTRVDSAKRAVNFLRSLIPGPHRGETIGA